MKIERRDHVCSTDLTVRPRDDSVRRWLRSRELGAKATLGHSNNVSRQLYSSVEKVRSWNPMHTTDHTHHGGIFNFDFSKDGSVLVAACEKRSILVFDPLNGNLIASKNKAHNDCVNCVRFLDSRMFATCSDDTTVCLWDVRFMKHKVRTLKAHSNWVKNIEYDATSGLLVTSGFDGSIFTWDINRYTETEDNFRRVFHTPGLMRMKLTPDASKLVVATGSGYLMVIHDLDLATLAVDLGDFVPNVYRLMQQSNSPIPQAYNYNHLFSQGKNRVELISDFPADNKADMIASLEVHPQGWCVVSRNTSTYEASEWTCVHDIQEPAGIVEEYNELLPRGIGCGADLPRPSCSSADPSSQSVEEGGEMPAGSHQQSRAPPESAPASTEPSRTGSPAFVLSISINESTASPPNISQSDNTVGSREAARSSSPGTGGNLLSVATVPDTDPFSSSSVSFDLTQPLQGHGSSSEEEEVEEGEEGVLDYDEDDSRTSERISRNEDQLVRQDSSNSSTGSASADAAHRRSGHSSPLNVPNSPTSPSPASPSASPVPGQAARTSAIDVLPSLHVQSAGTTFQSRWENDNDVAFMRPPNNPASPNTTSPTSSSTAPISADIRLGESLTVLIRSSRRGGLVLLGHNKVACNTHPYIQVNCPRLTHYVEELNVGRGFIKEVSFSNDGRLICSPYGFGVRLLAFDACCSEMCDVVPSAPVKLHPLTSNMSHTSAVVTTKFSPLHCMFVSGCLNGKVDFHQPVL